MLKKLRQNLNDEDRRLTIGAAMTVILLLCTGVIPEMIARWPLTAAPVAAYAIVMCRVLYGAARTDGDDGDGEKI